MYQRDFDREDRRQRLTPPNANTPVRSKTTDPGSGVCAIVSGGKIGPGPGVVPVGVGPGGPPVPPLSPGGIPALPGLPGPPFTGPGGPGEPGPPPGPPFTGLGGTGEPGLPGPPL